MSENTTVDVVGGFFNYSCPEYGPDSDDLIDAVQFWFEGVALSAVALFGVAGNVLSTIVLTRPEMRNAFNLLLVGLACYDTAFIASCFLETLRKVFNAATQVHLLLYPYLLFPVQTIALTGSTFLLVAIAFERYD